MRILFDQGAPAPLRKHLHPHPVDTTAERDWSTISNGELLKLAEDDGYEVFITTDRIYVTSRNSAGVVLA